MTVTTVRAELHRAFATVAVTGTNGKTTTTGMIEAIVRASGEPHARVTTLGSWVNGVELASDTELDAFSLAIERGAEVGIRTLALETTSRALAEGFSHLWPARVAVFTNLSRDHLDYHGDPEHYLAAKAQLFMTLSPDGAAVLNAVDPASALLSEITPPTARRFAYAASRAKIAPECGELVAQLVAAEIEITTRGTCATLEPSELAALLGGKLELAVLGVVNVENALAAALACHALGYSPEAIHDGLRDFPGVRGRFERVFSDPLVVVDYAHTPDALAKTLALSRSLAGEAAVIVVFGCGGESDPGKRPEMGQVAARLADHVIVTNDNPRHEDPEKIAEAVRAGALSRPNEEDREHENRRPVEEYLEIELDRAAAIGRAIEIARRGRGDIVVIAGKGHETTQCIGDTATPFDDAELARAVCRARFESEDG